MMGFYTDSHTGGVPDEVWNLLSFVVPLTANLRGVTFEFHIPLEEFCLSKSTRNIEL